MTPIVTLESGVEVEGLTFDSLDLNDEITWELEALTIAPPSKRLQRLSAADADSDVLAEVARHDLRTVTVRVRYVSAAGMDAALTAIRDLVARLQRAEDLEEGSPLVWTPATSTRTGTMHVQSGEITEMPIELDGDNAGWLATDPRPVLTVRFDCFPFIEGTESQVATITSSARILSLEVPAIAGDVPALAKLTITDTATQDRRHVELGGDHYGYNAAAPSDLDILATEMTALAGSLSGSYITYEVAATPIAICEAAGLPHLGPHKVRAQLERTAADADIYVRGAFRTGDGTWVRTSWQLLPMLVGTYDVELGHADFAEVEEGTQGSTIRIESYASKPATLRVYRFNPIPTELVYARMRSRVSTEAPTSFPIFDGFNQTAGALAGKTAGAGGVHAGGGDSDDFQVDTATQTAQRTAVSDINNLTGRYDTIGASTFTDLAIEVTVSFSDRYSGNDEAIFGLLARWVDASNWLAVGIRPRADAFGGLLVLRRYGASYEIKSVIDPWLILPNYRYRLRLELDTFGNWKAWAWLFDYSPRPADPRLSGQESMLATGGTLATGKVGLYDAYDGSTAITRSYDGLLAYGPTEDMALYSGRSAVLASRYAVRESAAGGTYGEFARDDGRRLWLPAGGPDARKSRLVLKDRRADVDAGQPDSADSARTATLRATPRYLAVP